MTCPTLADLINGSNVTLARGHSSLSITALVEDSRHVVPGCLFIARSGTRTSGNRFIGDALDAGAAAVLVERADDVPAVTPQVAVLCSSDVRLAAAMLAERFHGNPSRSLQLIGITGTNGKTTTASLVHQLLNRHGMRCGLIGTVQIDDGSTLTPSNLTTPPAIELSGLLRRMVDRGCKACVMETSSHALHQKRTAGLAFDIGIFTNLTGDHLDYHQTMEAYRDAKRLLFASLPQSGRAIVNIDDQAGDLMLEGCCAPSLRCSVHDQTADCSAKIGRQTLSHIETDLTGPWGVIRVNLPLIGRHNVFNALQAIAACNALGVGRDELEAGIAQCSAPPGRLEPVTSPNDDFAVLVDYAHTDDALENVLVSLRSLVPAGQGRLRVIFGCGGDRDRTKRPRMARTAWKYADDVIITSDNPRTEPPESILADIRAGVPAERLAATACVVDRAAAIALGVERTRRGDVLLIAGKGHEDYQIIGTQKRPFDDRTIAAAALASRIEKAIVA